MTDMSCLRDIDTHTANRTATAGSDMASVEQRYY